jgi:hypothetical protein
MKQRRLLRKLAKIKKPKKMVAGAFFLLRRRCGLVKDRRRAKNLLHRLNVGIPSDKKSTGNLKS